MSCQNSTAYIEAGRDFCRRFHICVSATLFLLLSPNIAHNSVINTSKLSSILEFISNNSTNHDNAMLVRRVPINPTFAKSLGS
jgi:hypothetical protein